MKSTLFVRATLLGLALTFSGCLSDGKDGLTALIHTTTEPAGLNCTEGGIRIDVGLDDDRNGILGSIEIDSTSYLCNAGVSNAPDVPGEDGLSTLINTTTEPVGINCSEGGVRIDLGLDDDGNGILEISEIDSTSYVCNGAGGLDGTDGLMTLISTTAEPAGLNCTEGGIRIDAGLDDNANSILESSEIDNTSYVCNGLDGLTGVDGVSALVFTTAEPAGANCTAGGTKIIAGFDDDGNGILDVSEVDSTSYVCNGTDGLTGADGLTALILTTAEPAGANCSEGGIRIDVGLDDDGNGTLESSEIDSTSYVCNGADGIDGLDGTAGADGLTTLILTSGEPAGANCSEGGIRIDVGLDDDGNGTLESSEIDSTSYVCNGTDGLTGADGLTALILTTAEPAGANCSDGGVRIDVGLDDDGNGTLESSEIDSTSYVCDGISAPATPQVAAGGNHTLSIKADRTLWAWGLNIRGQLGDGTTVTQTAPVQTGNGWNWQRVSAGYDYTVAINRDGTLWSWGMNDRGQLGDGSTVYKTSPVQIGSDSDWQSIATGYNHTVAIRADRTLWAWGSNEGGQLGDGSTVYKTSPVQIGSDSNWKSVTAGTSFTLAIKTDGTLWAWGMNNQGQLGIGGTATQLTPVQVTGNPHDPINVDTPWLSVTAGAAHTVAIRTDGTLWAWGDNSYGQLGDGYTYDQPYPVQIGSDSDWQSVTAGYTYTVAIKIRGTLWAWGNNLYGQLGDGTTVERLSPVQIGNDSNWQSVAAGENHTVAIKTDETVWAWGFNRSGQLGDGTTVNQYAPEFIY